jgi:DNA-binding beta-propeller fold protein YncE
MGGGRVTDPMMRDNLSADYHKEPFTHMTRSEPMTDRNPDRLTYQIVPGWGQLPDGWVFTQVAGVAVDSHDRVYVYNRGDHPVVVFDRDGNFLRSWGEGILKNGAHGIFIDSDDHIYLVDRAMQMVMKFTLEGECLLKLGTENQANEGRPFNNPTDVAVSSSGEIYVSDGYGNSLVHKFSPNGELIISWGEHGTAPGQFDLPHSVWVDEEQLVYVADRENHRIQVFNTNCEVMDVWTGFRRPTDIFVDDNGYVYVSELHHRVSILSLNGEVLTRLGGEESREPGQFIAPHGVWTDSRNSLYVGEVLKGQRIQKFVRDPNN